MIDGSLITIAGLYAVVGESYYSLSVADVRYNIHSNPRGTANISVIGESGDGEGDIAAGLDADVIAKLNKEFTPGALVAIVCYISEEGGESADEHTLFKGYVVSAQDSVNSTLNHFTFSYEVHLATPESLIPTNPTTETHTISQDSGDIRLISDSLVVSGVRKSGQLALLDHLDDVLTSMQSAASMNVAKFAAMAIDKFPTNSTTATDLPAKLADMVDVENAPTIKIPDKQASTVASCIVERITNMQNSGYGDWATFVAVLAEFFQNPVPDGTTGKLVIKKAFPWSSTVTHNITPGDFTGFQNTHVTSLRGVFRAVAVAHPNRSKEQVAKIQNLSSYYLAAAGYTADGSPKWVSKRIESTSTDGNYMVDGVRLTNIYKMKMPAWLAHACKNADDGSKLKVDYWDEWAKVIATASVLSNLGAQGSLQLNMRLVTALSLIQYIGTVVSVDLPVSPPAESTNVETHKLYGMLREVGVRIILKTDGLVAHGSATLEATRADAEQQAFCVTSGIFADE